MATGYSTFEPYPNLQFEGFDGIVNNLSDLPEASLSQDKIYFVRKGNSGLYKSDGNSWNLLNNASVSIEAQFINLESKINLIKNSVQSLIANNINMSNLNSIFNSMIDISELKFSNIKSLLDSIDINTIGGIENSSKRILNSCIDMLNQTIYLNNVSNS